MEFIDLRVGVIIISMLITSCSVISPVPVNTSEILMIDGMSVITTGKTISDHVFSYSSGKNCSTLRRKTGQNFCEEDDISLPEEVYCYNSLGSVNCFEKPVPYGQGKKAVGHISGKSDLIR